MAVTKEATPCSSQKSSIRSEPAFGRDREELTPPEKKQANLANMAMPIALRDDIHARPPHKLPDLTTQFRVEETGGKFHAVVVESVDNLSIALNDPP